MSNIAIKVENLSKAYQLGQIGTGTISRDLERWYARIRGKEDPFLRIGESNNQNTKSESDVVWSLKDINFEIEQGDAVGIIGRNGAGKSTLLKILSKVTAPTTGKISGKGRIASLLEVGTGFHPELSGRENIFLNGAILGMRKKEIQRKLDEIVDFAGMERYLDTPVKRYSSGMYVRLAFAVAAHLESEILIVDEVLAVGDADFQKKCLGKMGQISTGEGRTVLFVSHNMDAVNRICKRSILLNQGTVEYVGRTDIVIDNYLKSNFGTTTLKHWDLISAPGNNMVKLLKVFVHQENTSAENLDITKQIHITINYQVLIEGSVFTHGINLFDSQGTNILNSHDVISELRILPRSVGVYSSSVCIPENFLAEGIVVVGVALFSINPFDLHVHELEVISFNVYDNINGNSARGAYTGGFPGVVRPILNWQTDKL